MAFFYILHTYTWKGKDDTDGSKNARTFLFGAFAYICLYMCIMHYSLRHKDSAGIFQSGLLMMLIVDFCVMAYIYKRYYGRIITHELFTTDESEKDWKYDDKLHQYDRKNMDDITKESEIGLLKQSIDNLKHEKLKIALEKDFENEVNAQ